MKHITFWFDFISPYAYLAFEKLPEALKGLSYRMDYRPVLFAGLLKHHGQLGPAEIPSKRAWTYRQVLWLAHAHGIPMQLPAAHPFNPLGLLRLALACGEGGVVNRYVADTLMRHAWRGGADAADAQRLQALQAQLQPARDPALEAVKAELRANTDAAIAQGLFGVPTCEVDGKLFWGLDSLPMLRAYLEGNDWFASGAWEQVAALPTGKTRSVGSASPSPPYGVSDGTTRAAGVSDGTTRAAGVSDGTTRAAGVSDGTTRAAGVSDGTTRAAGVSDGTTRAGVSDGTTRAAGLSDGNKRS